MINFKTTGILIYKNKCRAGDFVGLAFSAETRDNSLDEMCLAAAQRAVKRNDLPALQLRAELSTELNRLIRRICCNINIIISNGRNQRVSNQ